MSVSSSMLFTLKSLHRQDSVLLIFVLNARQSELALHVAAQSTTASTMVLLNWCSTFPLR